MLKKQFNRRYEAGGEGKKETVQSHNGATFTLLKDMWHDVA